MAPFISTITHYFYKKDEKTRLVMEHILAEIRDNCNVIEENDPKCSQKS
jgi:hypothetical protein